MKRPRTDTEAFDALSDQVAWRIKEISTLQTAIRRASTGDRKTMLRSAVPIYYAHWEGFVKGAAETYLQLVANRRLPYEELLPCFVAVGMASHMSGISVRPLNARAHKAVERIVDSLGERAAFRVEGAVDTRSNLSSEVFTSIMMTIGLDPTPYETKYNFIDSVLLRRRNSIAHGEHPTVESKEVNEIASIVVALIRQLKTDIENAIVTAAYRRH